jgi:Ca2+-binding RTX toxin-like protein
MNVKKLSSISLIATALALVPAAAASADAPGDEVFCHGQIATYVGTAGDDTVSDAESDLGRNPVIALGEGNDTLSLGSGYHDSLDSLTVCGGSGDDSLEVTEAIGGHAVVTLDGGLGDDFAGNNSGISNSDLAKMELVGGEGNDVLRGGNGNDVMDAGRGDDSLYGVGGRDKMKGGTGNDSLFGQRGSDHLYGGTGYDRLDGDMPGYPDGRDVADGGANRDRCEADVQKSCEAELS